ncbi:MAG TPA: sigma-70 family RNA polymerase sigma factor [Firmicutes bacterium]|nr:sigma-70 family RNA polymerase sigma factor [Bacillota bacterium]
MEGNPLETSAEGLIERCKKGNVEAFEELITPYLQKVYNLALRLSRNREDASDLAQEALLRAFANLKDFRAECSFSTWLYRITFNVCRDEARRRRRHPTLSLDEPVMSQDGESSPRQLVSSEADPLEHAQAGELRDLVWEGIRSLSPEFRAVLVLRDVEGLAYEEIAETLEISLGTVKSRLNRARNALKARFATSELFPDHIVRRGRGRPGP